MTSSSSSPAPSFQPKWDVFISFRGKDTRQNFLSFLFKSLEEKGIYAFKDEKLHKGAEITPSLLQTIQDSYISIVIFSQNYADSPWCLDELVQINECREKFGQIVVPLFYRVDPTDVQELKGDFAKAWYKLEKEHDKHKVGGWRCALETISNELSGWVSNEFKNEQLLVQEIVDDVWEKLKCMPSSSSFEEKLVGIESRVDEVKQLLELNVNDWRTIGIWGMPGIGKSTLASQLFLKIKNEFDVYCFVSNVRKELTREDAIVLRDRIIGELFRDKNLKIGTPLLGEFIKRRLRGKKVLIVLDDVDSFNQLFLVGADCRLFREGSRIIITSTDRQVLVNVCKEEHVYEVEKLSDDNEALPLFSSFAFHQDQPKDGFAMLSYQVLRYAEGNPLAIRVLGSNFYGMEKEDWERELAKLESIPNMEIQQVLKVGYDGLDRDAQSIFLDIACLFNHWEKMKVERVLEGCGFHAKRGIRRLIDKSLINNSDYINMHKLIEQMGKEIVNEESKRPGKRSRLWNSKDILHVLKTDTGTQSIEGISLSLDEIGSDIELSSTAFMKMPNLRFLDCSGGFESSKAKIILPSRLDYLPEQLRYLLWEYFYSKSLSLNLWANNLVELHLPSSYLEELIAREESLKNLKIVNLSMSQSLVRISNSFKTPNLEKLDLNYCKSLVEIPSSLQHMSKLKKLNLRGCGNIRECPEVPCSLRELNLIDTLIKQLPSSIVHCSHLVKLNLSLCTELEKLPDFIDQLRYLEILNVEYCPKLEELPSNFGDLKSLILLRTTGSGLKKLPPLTGLTSLETLDLRYCGILEIPESIGSLVSLLELYLDGNDFESIPASINQLSKLKRFKVKDCKRLRNLPELPQLDTFRASNCISLEYASLFQEQKEGYDYGYLDFCECTNLNKEASLKIMEDVLSTYPNKKWSRLRIPGGELPEKIRYRASGSHISFEVEERHHHNITGYFYCVVIHTSVMYTHIECFASFKDAFGKIHRFNIESKRQWIQPNLSSEHVFIWYEPFCCKESITEASFEFSADEHYVIQCGIHPVIAKECADHDNSGALAMDVDDWMMEDL